MPGNPQSEIFRYFKAVEDAIPLIKNLRPDLNQNALYVEAVKVVEFLYDVHGKANASFKVKK